MHSVALSKTGHVSFTLWPVTLFMSFSLLTEGETIPLWIPPQIRLIFLSVSNTHIHQQTNADKPKHFLSSLIVKFPLPFVSIVLSVSQLKSVFSPTLWIKVLFSSAAVLLLEEAYCCPLTGRTTEQTSPCLYPSLSPASSYPPWSLQHRAVFCPAVMWPFLPS